MTHSSGSRLLDRAALDAVRDAVVQRPPDALVGTRSGVTSDWIFWAGEVVPFIGAMTQGGLTGMTLGVSCMDGPTGDGVQCSAAGRPLLRTRVELIDVHDATYEHARMALPTPPAEPASALGDPAAAPEPPPR